MRDNSLLREILLTLLSFSSILHEFLMTNHLPAPAVAAVEEAMHEDAALHEPIPSELLFISMLSTFLYPLQIRVIAWMAGCHYPTSSDFG